MVPDVSKERIAHITGSLGCEWKGNTILRNKTFRKRVLPTLPDLSVVNVKAILYSETSGNTLPKTLTSHRTRPGFSIVPLWEPHSPHYFVIYAIHRRREAKPFKCAASNRGGLKNAARLITLHAPPSALIPNAVCGPDRHRRISLIYNVVTHWPEGSKRSDVPGKWRTTCVSRHR